MRRLPCKFQLGTVVWMALGEGEECGHIIQVQFRVDGGIVYGVEFPSAGEKWLYEISLTDERPSPFHPRED